jgi:hypothetical protein
MVMKEHSMNSLAVCGCYDQALGDDCVLEMPLLSRTEVGEDFGQGFLFYSTVDVNVVDAPSRVNGEKLKVRALDHRNTDFGQVERALEVGSETGDAVEC